MGNRGSAARGARPLVLAVVALLAAGEAGGREARAIRVRLDEGPGPVQLDLGDRRHRLAVAGEGLSLDGRAVGRVWRNTGSGSVVVDGLPVRGRVEVARVEGGLRVVNHVPLEAYVEATLGREIYPTWSAETLKAQAVVIRTYALHERERAGDAGYDVGAGTGSQVYGGMAAEGASVRAAVEGTRGEYLEHAGTPILAAFHSSSGGRTASAAEVWGRPVPYLVSLAVPHEEDSPDTYWRASVPGTTLGRAFLPGGARVEDVRVLKRSESGRALRVGLRGGGETREVEGRAVRAALGASVIRSTLFEVLARDGVFVFVGSGHGHGVGMSQWGAQALAKRGADYRRILAHFYPGTRLVRSGAR